MSKESIININHPAYKKENIERIQEITPEEKTFTIPEKYQFVTDIKFSSGYGLTYVAVTKDEGNEKFVVVSDGEESKKYNYIFNLIYSPNNKHLGYIANKIIKKKK